MPSRHSKGRLCQWRFRKFYGHCHLDFASTNPDDLQISRFGRIGLLLVFGTVISSDLMDANGKERGPTSMKKITWRVEKHKVSITVYLLSVGTLSLLHSLLDQPGQSS